MIVALTASAVRSRAKRAGYLKSITIRSGHAAERAEHNRPVNPDECSVRICGLKPGVEEWVATLPTPEE